MKIKDKIKNEDYIDFGQWLYELRTEKGYSEYDLMNKINMPNVQEKNIRKWERDLELPDLEVIYKLSEIYMISSSEFIDKKNRTLQEGVNGINIHIVRILSLLMGIPLYGAIGFYYVMEVGGVIAVIIAFILFNHFVFTHPFGI